MRESTQRTLDAWGEAQLASLHPRIQRLVALANWDLYNGPTMDGQDDDTDSEDGSSVVYPGFVQACQEISAALDKIHTSDVWVDVQADEVCTSEPQPWEDDNPDHDEDDPESPATVMVEPCWEDYTRIDSREVKAAIVGRELAAHV